jgi:hypothetical protein
MIVHPWSLTLFILNPYLINSRQNA